MTRKTFTLIGAAAGLALFIAVALLPAILYGGYAGVLLAGRRGRRSRDVSRARPAARDARPARGVPGRGGSAVRRLVPGR